MIDVEVLQERHAHEAVVEVHASLAIETASVNLLAVVSVISC